MKIQAAIFDMDGTLIDSLMFWDVLWSTLGKRYLGDETFRPTEEDDKKVRTLTLQDAMHLIHRNYHIGENGNEVWQFATDMLHSFYAERVELKEGVRPFLDYCKAQGVQMCIASATASELLEAAIEHCDLGHYFTRIFSCAALGKGKDQPDIFLQAAEFLGTEIQDTWVFEDSLTAIETATKIGMPTVGIYDRYNFGHEQMAKIATHYIGPGETLMKLIEHPQSMKG